SSSHRTWGLVGGGRGRGAARSQPARVRSTAFLNREERQARPKFAAPNGAAKDRAHTNMLGVLGDLGGAAFERLHAGFEVEPRGPVGMKGKGPMPTWYLIGRRASRQRLDSLD